MPIPLSGKRCTILSVPIICFLKLLMFGEVCLLILFWIETVLTEKSTLLRVNSSILYPISTLERFIFSNFSIKITSIHSIPFRSVTLNLCSKDQPISQTQAKVKVKSMMSFNSFTRHTIPQKTSYCQSIPILWCWRQSNKILKMCLRKNL